MELTDLDEFEYGDAHLLLQALNVKVPKDYSPLLDKFFLAHHIYSHQSVEDFKSVLHKQVPFPWKDDDINAIAKYCKRFMKENKNILKKVEEKKKKLVSVEEAEKTISMLHENREICTDNMKSDQFDSVCEFYQLYNNKEKYAPLTVVECAKKLLSNKDRSCYHCPVLIELKSGYGKIGDLFVGLCQTALYRELCDVMPEDSLKVSWFFWEFGYKNVCAYCIDYIAYHRDN